MMLGAVVLTVVGVVIPLTEGRVALAAAVAPGVGLMVAASIAAQRSNHRLFARLFRAAAAVGLAATAFSVFDYDMDPAIGVYGAILVLLTMAYLVGIREALGWAVPCLALVVVVTVFGPESPDDIGIASEVIIRVGVVVSVLVFALTMRRSHDLHAAELTRLATTDPLTGIANRIRFDRDLEGYLATAEAENGTGALAFFDLDDMKLINDTYGHRAGDQYLRDTADRLRAGIRSTDVVGRVGGDEFAVIFFPVASPGDAQQLADRLRGVLAEPWQWRDETHSPTASVGVAPFGVGQSADEVMRRADTAMYRAKRSGGARTYLDGAPLDRPES